MLELRDIVKRFPVKGPGRRVVHAVEGVSFSIPPGETLGLVGESGCGKSTVARTAMRIYEPTSGSILLDGEDITGMRERELKTRRKKIQMIFQDPYASLNARMKVRDIIAEPLVAHGAFGSQAETTEAVASILERVGLGRQHMNRYPHEFSGGQRQRIGIARALILGPKVMICDEPISALDVSIQAQVVNLLKSIQRENGISYLFIAHDLAMVRYVSHTVGVMYLGRIVERCRSEEIYGRPLHPYTKGLLASAPSPRPPEPGAERAPSIEGDIPSPIAPPPGCAFHTRCRYAEAACREAIPVLRQVESGHEVACHLF
ncbi:MAG: ATP-binding cassette domain-containing protein [Spirochaetes bacterium]|nr:ATP-binding cassette domain-containing protein [Spirochaetota bacterium]MBU1081050.1 ATP-binding cassette domain-containing protein [Spirochaetota bacterium]